MGSGPSNFKKKKIHEMKFERMKYISEHFQDQHLERVDKCEIIESLMWENYCAEKNPINKVKILESIIEMQSYLSAYYDATRYVLMQNIKADLSTLTKPSTTYLSVNSRKWNSEELERQQEQGKIFSPYEKDADPDYTITQTTPTPTPSAPRPTTFPTITDPNDPDPDKWITDPAWIQENIKKMRKNSNLKDFDSTRKK
jgi:hypothetical protein